MNINEALKQYETAKKASRAAYKALQEAEATAREAWHNVIFNKNNRVSPEYTAAQELDKITGEARKKYNFAAAVSEAAASNLLYVIGNTARAAILAAPEKFNKPVHYKVFKDRLAEALPGVNFYIDSTFSCSLYINFTELPHNHNSIFICEKEGDYIKIDPEKFNNNMHKEFTLQEIKKEAKQAIKDAEKIRAAEKKLESQIKEIRNKYNTHVRYILPDYYSGRYEDPQKI